jgi:hypothetical protein
MKVLGWSLSITAAASLLFLTQFVSAQSQSSRSHVAVPDSSIERPADLGVNAHNHLLVMMPETGKFPGNAQRKELPPVPGFFFETPASIACVYNLVQHPATAAIRSKH